MALAGWDQGMKETTRQPERFTQLTSGFQAD